MYTWDEVNICYAESLNTETQATLQLHFARFYSYPRLRLFPHFFGKNLVSCCFSDFCRENTCKVLCSDIKVMFCSWLSNVVTVSSVPIAFLLWKILVGRLWLEEKNGPCFTICPSIQAINSHLALPLYLHYTSYKLKRSQKFSFLCTLHIRQSLWCHFFFSL